MTQIAYHYGIPASFSFSCWDSFGSILSNRDLFPHLKAVDAYLTSRVERLSLCKLSAVWEALRAAKSYAVSVTYLGNPGEVVFVSSKVFGGSSLFFFLKYRLVSIHVLLDVCLVNNS